MSHRTLEQLSSPAEPGSIADSPLSEVLQQPLLLGVFLPLQNGAWSQSTYPRGTGWSFEYNRALVRRADELGFELGFGLSGWLPKGGHGGEQRYRENHLDPFIAAVGLAASARRMILAGTVHVLYRWHPLMLAKQLVTADHVAAGRFGVNIVTGSSPDGARMFGIERAEHDARYQQADEFVRLMKDLWQGDDALTYEGRYPMREAYISPRPRFGRPILLSASSSAAGFDYGAAHSDVVFTSSPVGERFDAAIEVLPEHVASIKRRAAAHGRKVRVIINATVITGPTDAAAHAYYDDILRHADDASLASFDREHRASDSQAWVKHDARARAVGGHVHVVGSWDTVAGKLARLHEAGMDGVQLTFYDYMPELELFATHVIPRLEALGLRHPISPT
ncbi:LLM class flavin-dependent oxidoreductase [Chitinasiproducens palmae]|uniref:FMNH2-dependent dimethyl sulfone monooxygenase n=1 Tax=Chitinasiproducens palmae TaxID=1770053 RepID=A0A1H2PU59_9BURK|nr:LLM class flavin-dependent oxidoreductase [Chitinasiproducens palmae]SDV50687.1 FMNH2-dependent dimethyl sulfone monooxygenase [Chitinasiproducens palmae]